MSRFRKFVFYLLAALSVVSGVVVSWVSGIVKPKHLPTVGGIDVGDLVKTHPLEAFVILLAAAIFTAVATKALGRRKEESQTIINALDGVSEQIEGQDEKLEAALSRDILPEAIREAVIQPQFEDISRLIEEDIREAHDVSVARIERVESALEGVEDPDGRIEESLRNYRQRLMLVAASTEAWLGNQEEGQKWWRQVRDLGPLDPSRYQQAVTALFNVGLPEELRHLINQMGPGGAEQRKAEALVAYLEEDWDLVNKNLRDSDDLDSQLLRLRGFIETLDATIPKQVRRATDLLDDHDPELSNPLLALSHLQAGVRLLNKVIRAPTPLEFDRKPLMDWLLSRVQQLLEATEEDSPFRSRVLGVAAEAADLLRDTTIKEKIRREIDALPDAESEGFFDLAESPPAPDEVEELLSNEEISPLQAVVFKAVNADHRGAKEEVERVLREGLYTLSGKPERARTLQLLIQHLNGEKRLEEADKLIEQTPIREADRRLLRAQVAGLRKGRSAEKEILESAVDAFPLNPDILERLTNLTLRIANQREDQPRYVESDDQPPPPGADLAVERAEQFLAVLPTRSSRRIYAEALFLAQRHEQLLNITDSLDEVFEPRVSELKALALDGLKRTGEAADLLVETFSEHSIPRLAVNASALLLKDERPGEVISLFGTETETIKTAGLLVNVARAHISADPLSKEASSTAFDLLKEAFELEPDQHIAEQAWKAARGARREREAHSFFATMMEGASKIEARSVDDLEEIPSSSGFQLIELSEGIDPLIEWKSRSVDRTESLNDLNRAHMIAYSDLFRFGGYPWENWARWTASVKEYEGGSTQGAYSVLADWPTSVFQHQRRFGEVKSPLLADLSVLLTLGVLDTDKINSILSSLGTVHIFEGTLGDLEDEIQRLENDLQIGRAQPYREVVSLLREKHNATVPYTEEVEEAAPSDTEMGAVRVDLGAAILEDGIYVTDLDEVAEWSETVQDIAFSSARVLAALNREGKVTAQSANSAAETIPDTFGDWDTEDDIDLPEAIFFNPFTLLDWVEVGLVEALDDRLRVGPWAWTHLVESSSRQEAQQNAYSNAVKVKEVLDEGLETGVFKTVASTEISAQDEPSIERLWESSLKTISTARKNGLQIWADDRFYPLFLWQGGTPVIGPEIQELRAPFVEWAASNPPISTFEVLDKLSQEGKISATTAQEIASQLYSVGYRPSHPIHLDHALQQYQLPEENLSPPFSELAQSIREFPHYLPDSLADERIEGFSRVGSVQAGERLLRQVWLSDDINDDKQRRLLSDAFLEAIEDVFESNSSPPTATRSNLTSILFWRGVAVALRTIPEINEEHIQRRTSALRWLGDAASQREDYNRDIVRLLEDNVLKSLEYSGQAAKEITEHDRALDLSGRHAFVDLIPLIESDLVDELDPLLRRSIGIIADLPREGRIDTIYSVSYEDKELTLKISEEDEEEHTKEVFRRALSSDPNYQRFFRATSLTFNVDQSAPDEWVEAGVPEGHKVPVDIECSLFNLLGDESPVLRKSIVRLLVHQLSQLDPPLALELVKLEDSLTDEDMSGVQSARKVLSAELLRSGYFDLQRDLVHAIRRYRDYTPNDFNRFLGFIEEEEAKLLSDRDPASVTTQLGSAILPKSHFAARTFLTEEFVQGLDLHSAIRNLTDPNEKDTESAKAVDSAGEKPEFHEWLAGQIAGTEDARDPFGAAYSLRRIMIGLLEKGEDVSVKVNGNETSVSDWTRNYILASLRVEDDGNNQLTKHMVNRRQLASSVLRLAGHACGGQNHVSQYDEDDPLSEWLDHTWLLSSKLRIALIGFEGSCERAARKATSAVRELALDSSNPDIPDVFDPLAYGFDGEDIGISATLTAILQTLRETPEEPPSWWNDEIRDAVESLPTSPPLRPRHSASSDAEIDNEPDQPEWGNRLGFKEPLRSHLLRKQILEIT